MLRLARSLALTLLCTPLALAAIESGPAVDSALPELKADATTGDDAGKKVIFTTTRKAKPTVYVFIRADKFDRPIARYLKTLDKALVELGKDAHVVAVALNDRAHVTTVVTDGVKVKARFAEQSLNETNVPEVTAALKPLLK